MKPWKTLSSKIVHETKWFQIVEDKVLDHNGKEITYTYLNKDHGASGIVAVNAKGQILLQKHFVYPIKQTIWAIPGGHNEGEDPLVTAKRELEEETGLSGENWRGLGSHYSAAGISHVVYDAYTCIVSSDTITKRDDDEALSEQRFFDRTEVMRMINDSEITDGFSLLAIYKYIAQTGGLS